MPAYLDCNATTPIDPRVRRAMEPWLAESFGNPASRDHAPGWDAAEALEDARATLAGATGAGAHRVVFTSGASEGLNTVLRAYVGFAGWRRKAIVTCATEHAAVLAPSRYLCERTGVRLEVLPVDRLGRLDLDELRAAVARSERPLVAIMAANNETGVTHPVGELAALVRDAGGLFLCDTTQTFGKAPLDLAADGVDFAVMSAHKLHGPKGVGALFVREGLADALDPLILGGGQEGGMRGGTANVAGIVGLAAACGLAAEALDADARRMSHLRDRLETSLLEAVDEAWVNGDGATRLCNTTSVGFKGVDARALIRDMHAVAASTRSACATAASGPSHVLKAMGLSDDDAYSCVRFSLGRFTTPEEIDYAIESVVTSVQKLRRASSVRA